MASHTVADVQAALQSLGFSPGDIDGEGGPKTAAAVAKFQETRGLTVNGKLDPATLGKLFPSSLGEPAAPRTIQATMMDWALNFAQSKIVWAAGLLLAAVVAWVNTKFGISVSPDIQNAVTSLIVAAGAGLIAILRGWSIDTPRVASTTPLVIQKPGEPTK